MNSSKSRQRTQDAATTDASSAKPAIGGNRRKLTSVPVDLDDTDAQELVTVNIKKGFRLVLNHHAHVDYMAGDNQTMPLEHAEHWYARAHGVAIVEQQ